MVTPVCFSAYILNKSKSLKNILKPLTFRSICVEAPPQLMGKGGHVFRKSYPDYGGHRCYLRLCLINFTLSSFILHFLLLNTSLSCEVICIRCFRWASCSDLSRPYTTTSSVIPIVPEHCSRIMSILC